MKIFLVISIVAVVLSGCSKGINVSGFNVYSDVCIDHVKYYNFTHGASVAYNANGKIKTC